ncbi:MAG: acetamidase/formamidase family protein [Parvibaculum sp.]|nr:acetamidase/formamidase family protein [Parvibaculum sp.]
MDAWHFSTESYSKPDRSEAWRDALERLALKPTHHETEDGAYGLLSAVVSQSGMSFTRLISTPQDIRAIPEINKEAGKDGVWVASLMEGRVTFHDGGNDLKSVPGDIVYGAVGSETTFTLETNCRMVIIYIPRSAFRPKLMAPLPTKVIHLSGRAGIGHVLAGFLASVSEALEDLSVDQLRPIEMALPEFLMAGIFRNADTRALGGAAGVRAALLHRVCQTVEAQLGDPDLSLTNVSETHGISPRYVQKLFESVGQSFTRYIRYRRLERCRYDLESPIHSQLSISDICFRWGFNDAAHFSRAFRDQYGASPREYRRSVPTGKETLEPWITNRGKPEERISAAREEAAITYADLAEEHLPINLNVHELPSHSHGRAHSHDRGDTLLAEAPIVPDAIPISVPLSPDGAEHHYLPATANTIHWGYFSRHIPPVLDIKSGDFVTIEALTQHAYDDYERMIENDPGAESVFHWTKDTKNVDRRGAGPMDGSTYGRGAGEGFGVHICTGPIAVQDAKPGDIIELRVLDIQPRPSASARFEGRHFGSNAAAWWGFHYSELLTQPTQREVITIYEIEKRRTGDIARAVYNYRWTPQTDPFGVVHNTIDYPGVPVDHTTIEKNFDVLKNIEIPLRAHFGVVALAPDHWGIVDSVPPAYFGGNIDNWRLGAGSCVFLPVSVPGALLSIGDPHASQGDSELCGTAIECSLTGVFQVILHKKKELPSKLIDLDYPLIETDDEWVITGFSHPNYLKELGKNAQTEVYKQASVDLAMRDAFRKTRRFLMTTKNLTEDEAISLISVAVDFGITQIVDGNWGVHAIIRKSMFRD